MHEHRHPAILLSVKYFAIHYTTFLKTLFLVFSRFPKHPKGSRIQEERVVRPCQGKNNFLSKLFLGSRVGGLGLNGTAIEKKTFFGFPKQYISLMSTYYKGARQKKLAFSAGHSDKALNPLLVSGTWEFMQVFFTYKHIYVFEISNFRHGKWH